MTIADKLQIILNAKQAIKEAIISKGVDVSDTDTLASYAEKVENIESTIAGLSISDLYSVDDDGTLSRGTNTDITCTATTIGSYLMYYAFYYHTGLASASFPNLTTIGNYGLYSAFNGCTGLTSASFPNLTTTGNYGLYYAFNGCTGLTSASFPNLTTIEGNYGLYGAFNGCTGLTSASFPNLTTIGSQGLYSAFSSCTGLTSASFPNLTTIGSQGLYSAFNGCTGLTSASFPNLTTIDSQGLSYAFNGCTNLTSLDLPSLSGTIYNRTFGYNKYLTKIWLPSTVTTIIAGSSSTTSSYSYSYSPFYNCSSDLVIYTDAEEQLDGWSDYWNYNSSSNALSVVYGATHEDFENA